MAKEHRNLTPAMPFCHLTFSGGRPAPRPYERVKVPEGTLGAALRKERWRRGLDQRGAASEIGTTPATYRNWEVNRSAPTLKHLPGAITFLGYDWRKEGTSLGDRIRRTRTAAGLSIRELAQVLKSDESTVEGWETGRHAPSRRSAAKLTKWLVVTQNQRSCFKK